MDFQLRGQGILLKSACGSIASVCCLLGKASQAVCSSGHVTLELKYSSPILVALESLRTYTLKNPQLLSGIKWTCG